MLKQLVAWPLVEGTLTGSIAYSLAQSANASLARILSA
jgi:hypothetical protein